MFSREVSINNRGDVAFNAEIPGGPYEVALRGNGRTVKTIASSEAGPANPITSASVDGKGRVYFTGILDPTDYGLFSARRPGQWTTHHLSSETEFGGILSPTAVRGDRVAFMESFDTGGFGVFVQRGASVTRIVETSGPYHAFRAPSIGSRGRVAIHADVDSGGGEVIISGRGGKLTVVAATSGGFETFGAGSQSLNGSGDVIFTAVADGGSGYALYGGADPVADEIVGIGAELAGSQVSHVETCGESLNDSGQIAFRAELDDGREVIVRADPLLAG
jgi:hypothetical protein